MYGEPRQFIPYTSAESQLRCLWPDGTESMHSTRCEVFGFRTKDNGESEGRHVGKRRQKPSPTIMFGFHLNFDSETFY